MAIIAGFVLPHPPVIIPEIGHGDEKAIEETTKAYLQVAQEIAGLKPDTIIISSPHAEAYSDYFQISDGEVGIGSFAQFRAPQVSFRVFYDKELVAKISALAASEHFPAGSEGTQKHDLDHGTMIPLYFINQFYPSYKIVRVGLSGLSLVDHYRFGRLIKEAVDGLGRRAVFIASGDLSHCQKEDGPYGFKPEGPKYDEWIMRLFKSGNFGSLFTYDPIALEKAEECGHRSFCILAGALDRESVTPSVLSHQDTYGVGYGVASFKVEGPDPSRAFADLYLAKKAMDIRLKEATSDDYVSLARKAIEEYVVHGSIIPANPLLSEEMLKKRAGVFVSIHEAGELRGCIGTTAATQPSIAQEIIHNAIEAATQDPRFPAIEARELPYLEISVDVLSPYETIASVEDLDVKKYGVIVENRGRRGLLLPNLDGVETVEQQIAIAKKKAGIAPEEKATLYRFEVVRHQ
jgi:AmmeMemoRadiSam system protein A/AmmeMemoRadiSam system protein B